MIQARAALFNKQQAFNTHKERKYLGTDKKPEVLFITSYPPRECGIATYTQDLMNALQLKFEGSFTCSVCALESDAEKPLYKDQPKFRLNTDHPTSFIENAKLINADLSIQTVVIQHEFGFFAQQEEAFMAFFNTINKPIVFVFHTVLAQPNAALKYKVQAMAEAASAVIVMTKNSAKIMIEDYGIEQQKLSIISHGTHLVTSIVASDLKSHYKANGRKVLATFGLLSSNKGIETTLNALPTIIETYPDVLFLILGKTHPTVVKNEGEAYRMKLEKMVTDLHLEEYVRFLNAYLPLHVLLEYLQLTDIYLFTSSDPNQAVSGTFSYAISSGCPVISTPIPHAIEVLSNDAGIIFPFDDSAQLATSVISLIANEKLRRQISLNGLHKMAPTAWENAALAHAKLFERLNFDDTKLTYTLPAIHLNHLVRMSTEIGIIQFAKIAQPDLTSGYTLDDNARALIAVCQHYELTHHEQDLMLMTTYLAFIKHCIQPDGTFLNYVNDQLQFTTQNLEENLEDSNGRAVWALGYLLSLKPILPARFIEEAETILDKVLPHLDKIHSTRAMAFVIKGLYYQDNKKHFTLLSKLANRMVQMYRHERKANWHWFENYMAYGNSLLSEAMLCAYLSTGLVTYEEIARESFDFLLSKIFIDGRIKVISNKGWLFNNVQSEIQIGGEQPIDVSYTILALQKFHNVFGDETYRQKMTIAFNWFLGENHLNQIIYNPCTGGCYDGLEEFVVNLNQGAESTISYLMARLSMQSQLNLEEDIQSAFKQSKFTEHALTF